MVIQWDEPETPNGQVTVSSNIKKDMEHSRKASESDWLFYKTFPLKKKFAVILLEIFLF